MHELSNDYYMCVPSGELREQGMKCLYQGREIEEERRKVDGLIHLEIGYKMRIAG